MVQYTVAVDTRAARACAFNTTTPCGKPGLIAELTLFSLRLFLDEPDLQLRIQPATGWSVRDLNRTVDNFDPHDQSVMGQVYAGTADFTESDMYLMVSLPVLHLRLHTNI